MDFIAAFSLYTMGIPVMEDAQQAMTLSEIRRLVKPWKHGDSDSKNLILHVYLPQIGCRKELRVLKFDCKHEINFRLPWPRQPYWKITKYDRYFIF